MAAAPAGTQDHELPRAQAHLCASMILILASLILLLLAGVTYASILQAAFLVGLGAFPILIMGTSRLILSGVTGRNIAGPAWLPHAAAALVAVGAIAMSAPTVPFRGMFAFSWTLGILAHAGTVLRTVRPVKQREPRPVTTGALRVASHRILDISSIVYASIAALLLPFAITGALPIIAILHLALPGFVILTILAVGTRIFPRFTGKALPGGILLTIALPSSLAPALLAANLSAGTPSLLVGASLEAAALFVFAIALLWMLATSKRKRPSFLAYSGAALSLLSGVTLGLLFAIAPSYRAQAPLHGFLNMFGFVGLIAIGTSIDIYGPTLVRGIKSYHRQNAAVLALTMIGVALVPVGVFTSPIIALAGLASYASGLLLHLLASIATLRRSLRPRSILAVRPSAETH